MKTIFFFLFLGFSISYCYGQADSLSGYRFNPKQQILFIIAIPGKDAVITKNFKINSANIDSIYTVSYDKSSEICKIMGVAEIWVIKPMPFTVLFYLNDIFNKYNIAKTDENLPIRVDNWIIDAPKTLIIDENEILNIKIVATSKKKFINIITKHPLTP